MFFLFGIQVYKKETALRVAKRFPLMVVYVYSKTISTVVPSPSLLAREISAPW